MRQLKRLLSGTIWSGGNGRRHKRAVSRLKHRTRHMRQLRRLRNGTIWSGGNGRRNERAASRLKQRTRHMRQLRRLRSGTIWSRGNGSGRERAVSRLRNPRRDFVRNSRLLKLAGRRHFQQAFGLLRDRRRFGLDFVRAFDGRVLYSDPLAYFQTSFFGQIEKLDARIFLRFSNPGDLRIRFDEVSGIRQPETNPGNVVSGQTGDGLHVHAAFAEIQKDAAVGGTEINILE
jgi:hypothetical protein